MLILAYPLIYPYWERMVLSVNYEDETMHGKNGYYIAQSVMALILVLLATTAAGCDIIGGIFKAGLWVGVVVVAVVVIGIILLIRLFKR